MGYTYWIQFSTEKYFNRRGHYHLNGECLSASSAFDIIEIIPGEVEDNDTISDDFQYGLNLSELCVGDKIRVQGNSERLWEVTEIKIWEDGREYAYELGLDNGRFQYIYNILGGYKNSTKYDKRGDIVEIIKKEPIKENKMTIDMSTLKAGDKVRWSRGNSSRLVVSVVKHPTLNQYSVTMESVGGYVTTTIEYDGKGQSLCSSSRNNIVEIIKKEPIKEVPKFKRNNAGKIAYSHLDPEFIESMIKVLMVNTYKDDSDGKPNWQNTPDNLNKDVLDSLWRHLNALYKGEVIDPTDGVPHAAKIAINAMIFNFHKKE